MSATANYQGAGVYRHYKGGLYLVVGLGLKEDTLVKPGEGPRPGHRKADELTCVIYRPLTKGSLLERRAETYWLREWSDFNALVAVEGRTGLVPRFERIEAT